MPVPKTHKNQTLAKRVSPFELIGTELGQVRQRIRDVVYTPDEQIRQCLEYIMNPPGKMIRPALVLLCGQSVGTVQSEHIDFAAMVELIHRASLLHDDVIDSAQIRRDKPTANKVWGNTAAVLLGDFLLSRAFYLGISMHVSEAADILSRTAQELCCGELRQNFCKGRWEMSLQEYYRIIEAKTAALFESSCRLGAMASKTEPACIEAFSQFGFQAGIAFQMADDLTDIIGTQEQAGKTLGTDLFQGKLTLPVIHWIGQDEKTKPAKIDRLERGCGRQELIRQLIDSGSVEYVAAQVQERIIQAKQRLEQIPQSPAKDALKTLADDIAGRLK